MSLNILSFFFFTNEVALCFILSGFCHLLLWSCLCWFNILDFNVRFYFPDKTPSLNAYPLSFLFASFNFPYIHSPFFLVPRDLSFSFIFVARRFLSVIFFFFIIFFPLFTFVKSYLRHLSTLYCRLLLLLIYAVLSYTKPDFFRIKFLHRYSCYVMLCIDYQDQETKIYHTQNNGLLRS